MTWRHYVYGMGALVRLTAREKLRMHDAVLYAFAAEKKDRDRWQRETQHVAGL